MKYKIRIVDKNHRIDSIEMDADSEIAVREKISRDGLIILEIKKQIGWQPSSLARHQNSRNRTLLNNFNIELLALLKAGLSLIESLEALIEKEEGHTRFLMLGKLIADVKSGKRFSIALSEQPNFFPPLYIGIVRASEETSNLPQTLARYIDYVQRGSELRRKTINASIYPLILLIVGSIVIFFLVGYVVPRFAEVYRDSGRELPLMSQLLLSWGNFFQNHMRMVLLLILGAGIFFGVIFAREGIAPLLRLAKRIPIFRRKMNLMELSRIYMTLGMLLEGGIVVLDAISIVSDTVSKQGSMDLRNAATDIHRGQPLSSALLANNLTTSISFRLIRVGEKSGQLGSMLTEAARFHEAEITTWIDRFSRAFEPILMALIGLVVGAIVVLLYMPIFDLAGSIS